MRRVRNRVEASLRQYPIENWSAQLWRRQFRMVCRFSAQNEEWPVRVSRWHVTTVNNGAHRSPGRLVVRWDDRLNLFAHTCLHHGSWLEACASLNVQKAWGCIYSTFRQRRLRLASACRTSRSDTWAEHWIDRAIIVFMHILNTYIFMYSLDGGAFMSILDAAFMHILDAHVYTCIH